MDQKNINWQMMHQHLADTQHLLEGNTACSIERAQKILHQRATELAKEFLTTSNKLNGTSIIEFILGSESYGIESMYVSRVCKAQNITRLPSTPLLIEGIINVHGNIICVINLKEIFGLTEISQSDLSSILIVNHDDIELGILADVIIGVESIALDTLQTSLPTLTGIRSEFLKGITQDQKIILNIPKLLAHKELIINDSV